MMHRGGRSNDDEDDVSNGAIDYYTTQFRKHKQSNSKDGSIQENLAFQYQHGYGVKKYIQWAIELYRSAAQQGYMKAQFNLGQLYENNSDIKFNFKKAAEWYTMAAKQGNDLAQNKLGQLYEKGLGVDMDDANALYWYTEAANQGNRDAQYSLGRLYRKGGGSIDQCYASATKWYSLAAQQGSSVAQNCLELLNQKGICVQETPHLSKKKRLCSKLRFDISLLKDPLIAEEQKKIASRALVGDGEAMYHIGNNYYHGIHFDQEKQVGFQWLIRAAKTKNEKARMRVANLYKEGNTVDQNYFMASIWYTRSAKLNDRDAQYDLGLLYKKGHGVRKGPLEASKWFIKSADQGHVTAPYQLGILKYEENGLDDKNQDTKEAFAVSAHRGHTDAYYKLGFIIMHCNGEPVTFLHLFKHAARLGSTRAQYLLGVLYERGQYIEHNLIKAKMHYTMAAKSTHPKFQFKMALKYLKGQVVDQNYSMAFDLFKRAAKNGLVDARNLFSMPILATTKPARFYALIVIMLETVSNQHDVELNIGYIYEFGITNASHCLFEKNWSKAMAWYNEGIIKGDPQALFRLGVMYQEGKGIEKDLENTLDCYTRAHHQGVTEATYRLACIYLGGHGVPQDDVMAFHLYTMASHKGHEKSRMLLSKDDTCKSADGPCKSDDEPRHCDIISMLKVVANTGNVALQYRLGVFYEESDISEAMEWYMLAARAGMLEACYKLGHLYGQEQDYRQAIVLFEKAAKGNHDDALYQLGQMYLYGRGVERDYLKAYELYSMAAQEGNDLAYDMLDPVISDDKTNSILMYKLIAQNGNRDLQYKLGVYYDKELGFLEAIKWYSMAAADLHREALYRLGILYEKGLGMEPNYQKSLQLYNQAADQGHSDAIYKLAILYYNGNGVDKDSSLAVKYCQEAAEKNNSTCQYILGTIYEQGHVVPKDILKALEWYSKAYLQGNDHSASKLYNMYIDVEYESEFYLKLFRILSVFEKSQETSDPRLYSEYGYMYYSLGTLYYYGRGPKKDVYAALKYFSIACHKYEFGENMITLEYNPNNPEGQDNLLGKLNDFYRYQHNLDNHGLSTQNLAQANQVIRIAKNYLKAFISAEHKCPESLIKIADMYLNGQGVTQNDTIALLLYKCVAEQQEDYVNFEFGIKFYRGEGANQNYQVSIVFLKKSAEQNYTRAQRYLGDMYYYGDGVDINYDEALKWYKQSINGKEIKIKIKS
jgi:TPR repeat protein